MEHLTWLEMVLASVSSLLLSLGGWLGKKTIDHGNTIARHEERFGIILQRLDEIRSHIHHEQDQHHQQRFL
jgi:hypothetical protein